MMILVFPPGWAPFAPFLALPQLKGYLNSEGYDAEIVDENIEFFDTILSTVYVEKNIGQMKKRWDELNNLENRNEGQQDEFIKLTKIVLGVDDCKNIDIIKNNWRSGKSYSKRELDNAFSLASLVVEEKYKNFKVTASGILNVKYSQDYMSSLNSYLEDKENNLYEEYFLNESDILEKVHNKSIIGISVTGVTQLYSALTLAKLVKDRYADKKIFLGGNFITRLTMYYSNKLKDLFKYVDFICTGDGELSLKALLQNRELSKIPNIAYLDMEGIVRFTESTYCGLEKIVIPNFDGFALDKYFTSNLILPLFTSRSCYSNCSFCTIAKATSGPYRTYSTEQTIHIIKALQDKYDCKYFTFVDETFNARRLLEFSKQVIAEGLDIYWYTETRLDYYLSLKETELIYKAGCRKMQFGVESYNENILGLMNKKIKFENIKETITNFIDAGIGVHLFFMIGFPGETIENAENSLHFMKDMYTYGAIKSNALLVTTGFGSFGLEIGSPVQKQPEKYQISIITDYENEDFIGLALQYIVNGDFLSADEAESIVRKEKGLDEQNVLSYEHRLFSEMQNFLEISSEIITNKNITKTNYKILKLNNGLFDKNDCNYIVANLFCNKIIILNDKKDILAFESESEDIVESIDSLVGKRLNPFIKICHKENSIYLKNTLTGEEFEVNEDTMEEIHKFNISISDENKYILDNDNVDFYNFLVTNNIVY